MMNDQELEDLRNAWENAGDGDSNDAEHDAAAAYIAALVAEVEQLSRWKGEALEVLSGWESVYDALGKPATPGQLKSEAAFDAVVNLIERDNTLAFDALENASRARHERDEALAEVERLRGAATDIERLSDTYTVEGTALVMQRMIEVRRQRDEARAVLGAVEALHDEWHVRGLITASQELRARLTATLSAPVQAAEPTSPNYVDCAGCGSSSKMCDETAGSCCDGCRATAGCTHSPTPDQSAEAVGGL